MEKIIQEQGHQFQFIEVLKERNKALNESIDKFVSGQEEVQEWLTRAIS